MGFHFIISGIFVLSSVQCLVESLPLSEERNRYRSFRENKGKFQGDIKRSVNRNAVSDKSLLWPKATISYTISSKYSTRERNDILKAMAFISKKTCIKFQPRKSEKDYLYIFSEDGCWSAVGREGNGKQELSLEENGCTSQQTIVHELMHAIGFEHHHSRTDRDKYIQILWENIDDEEAYNFAIEKNTKILVPWDFDSTMLYDPDSFSVNGYDTIVSRVAGKKIKYDREKPILSESDVLSINKLYSCK